MPKGPKAPKPSPQELQLQQQQAEQVRMQNEMMQQQMGLFPQQQAWQQQQQAFQQQQQEWQQQLQGYQKEQYAQQQEQNRRMDLLQPLLYQQMGLEPQYNEQGTLIGYQQTPGGSPEQRRYEQQQALAEQQMKLYEEQLGSQTGLAQEQMDLYKGQMQRAEEAQKQQWAATQEQQRLQTMLTPMQLEAAGYQAKYDDAGKMIGVEKKALTPEQLQQQQISTKMNERSLAALEGRLPVDAQLTDQLSQQEAQLHETLRRQLGEGYATSTPGIQALAEWNKQKAMVTEGARKGELTMNEQLSLGRQSQQAQSSGRTLGDLVGIGEGGRGLIGAYNNTAALGQMSMPGMPGFANVSAPGSQSQGYLGAAQGGRTFGSPNVGIGGGSFGGGGGGGGGGNGMGLLNYWQNERAGQFAQQQKAYEGRRGMWSGIGSILGGAAGGYFSGGNPMIMGQGAALGSNLGYMAW